MAILTTAIYAILATLFLIFVPGVKEIKVLATLLLTCLGAWIYLRLCVVDILNEQMTITNCQIQKTKKI